MSNFKVIGKCKCGYYLLRNEEDGRTFCPICSRKSIGLDVLFKVKDDRVINSILSFFSYGDSVGDIKSTRFKKFIFKLIRNTENPQVFVDLLKKMEYVSSKDEEKIVNMISEKLLELAENGKLREVLEVLCMSEDELYFGRFILRRVRDEVFRRLSSKDHLIEEIINELKNMGKLQETIMYRNELLKEFIKRYPEEGLKIIKKRCEKAGIPLKEEKQLYGKALYYARRKELLEKGIECVKEHFGEASSLAIPEILEGIAEEDILFLFELFEKHKFLEEVFFKKASPSILMDGVRIPEDEDKKLKIFEKMLKIRNEPKHPSLWEDYDVKLFCLFTKICEKDPSFATYYDQFCHNIHQLKILLENVNKKDPTVSLQILEELIEKGEFKGIKNPPELYELIYELSFQGNRQIVELVGKIFKEEYHGLYSNFNYRNLAVILMLALLKTGVPEAYELVSSIEFLRKNTSRLMSNCKIPAPEQFAHWHVKSEEDYKILHKNFVELMKQKPEIVNEICNDIIGSEIEFFMINYVPYIPTSKLPENFSAEVTLHIDKDDNYFTRINWKGWYDALRENDFGGVNAEKIDSFLHKVIEGFRKRYFGSYMERKRGENYYWPNLKVERKEKLKNFIIETANYLCDVIRKFKTNEYVSSIESFAELYGIFLDETQRWSWLSTEEKVHKRILKSLDNFVSTLTLLGTNEVLERFVSRVLNYGSSVVDFLDFLAKRKPKMIFKFNDKTFKRIFYLTKDTIIRTSPLEVYKRLKKEMDKNLVLTEILKSLPERKLGNSKVLWSRKEFLEKLSEEEKKIAEKINIPYRPSTVTEMLENYGFTFFEAKRIERKLEEELKTSKIRVYYDSVEGEYFKLGYDNVVFLKEKIENINENDFIPIRSMYRKKNNYSSNLRELFEKNLPFIKTLVNVFGSKNIYIWMGEYRAFRPEIIIKVKGKPIFFNIRSHR